MRPGEMIKQPATPRVVHIGAASASFVDSRIALPQLLGSALQLDFIVFDCLAEGVMSILARARLAGEPAYVTDFVTGQIAPHFAELACRGIKVIANAGGLDPTACAAALRRAASEAGVAVRVASVAGDDLSHRLDELVVPGTPDMFDGKDLRAALSAADQPLSLVAYTGALPIAAALDAGADIVISGRAVDSATTLGALIHIFGWQVDDFDLLSAGTLAGHLIECTTQVTGGTFTDWADVPDWANIGFPIAACGPDGSVEIFKPEGSGGIVTCGTVSEQLLYETGDPKSYIVPDVICDWSDVVVRQVGPDRVRIDGARGRGRPEQLKAALTWDRGWRATALAPIIGHAAAAKAERTAEALFERAASLVVARQMRPFALLHRDIVGGDGPGMQAAICRMVADHPDQAGAALFAREQSSIITSMAVGTSVPLGTTIRPITHFASFLLPRAAVELSVELDGCPVPLPANATAAPPAPAAPDPDPDPPAPVGVLSETLSLVSLAVVRSGDKGNLFNVGVVARDPAFLPYLWHALTPERVARHYAPLLKRDPDAIGVARYTVPGIHALNLVVEDAMYGGMLAHPGLDPAAKAMGQWLLDFLIPVPTDLKARVFKGPLS